MTKSVTRGQLLEEQIQLLAEAKRNKKHLEKELANTKYSISRYNENIRDIKAGRYG